METFGQIGEFVGELAFSLRQGVRIEGFFKMLLRYDTIGISTLIKPGVGHQDSHAGIDAFKGEILMIHVAEELDHAGKKGRIALWNRFCPFHLGGSDGTARNAGLSGINAIKYPVRPGADLIGVDHWVEQGSHRCL